MAGAREGALHPAQTGVGASWNLYRFLAIFKNFQMRGLRSRVRTCVQTRVRTCVRLAANSAVPFAPFGSALWRMEISEEQNETPGSLGVTS